MVADRRQPLELMRQVQIAAGGLAFFGTLLGLLVSPWFFAVPLFVGGGLLNRRRYRLLRHGAPADAHAVEPGTIVRRPARLNLLLPEAASNMAPTLLQAALALVCGSLVGFSLGLVGGGGSILAVPLLVYVVGVPDPHVAIGTSAVAVAANAAANLFGHHRVGNVDWRCALIFAGAGIAGALVGSTLGKMVDGQSCSPRLRCS